MPRTVGENTTGVRDSPAGQYVISGGHTLTDVVGVLLEVLSSSPLNADYRQVVANSTTGPYKLRVVAMRATLPGLELPGLQPIGAPI